MAWIDVPFVRKTPEFSLCGLNCALCPRHHTNGVSACPGCGGPGFNEQHPSCAIITCARKHGITAYCFSCEAYPCDRYQTPSSTDSFISYLHVRQDLDAVRIHPESYLAQLRRRKAILRRLIQEGDDGRSKGLFCQAANLLPLEHLEGVIPLLDSFLQETDRIVEKNEQKKRAAQLQKFLLEAAQSAGIDLSLRKGKPSS